MKKNLSVVLLTTAFGFMSVSAVRPRPILHQVSSESQNNIISNVMGIVSSGINIASHDGNPSAQLNAGLNIIGHLGSLIFNLARSIDPEDLRSMSEEEITQELLAMDLDIELQKRMPRYRLVRD